MSEQEGRDRTGASKYIPMYYSYIEQLSLLTTEQVGELVMALLRFGADGTEPTFSKDGNVYMAFSFILDSTKRASERSHARGVNGGLARAAGAEKDAKGRFLPSPSSKRPANIQQTQQVQQIQPYQYQSQYQYQKQKQHHLSDDVDDVVLKLVENDFAPLFESSVCALSSKDRMELVGAVRQYGPQIVEDGIMVAIDRGARTWDYTLKTIRTQAEQPDRKPEY